MEDTFIQIGEIYREHGVKGFVKVYLYNPESENFFEGQTVLIKNQNQNETIKTKIISVKPHQKWFLTQFDYFKNPEEVVKWRKAGLFLKKENIKKPEKNEIYLSDLVGYTIWDEKKIGVIKKIQQIKNRNFFIVEDHHQKEIMIPIIDEWITKIDSKQKKVFMKLPSGLLEL